MDKINTISRKSFFNKLGHKLAHKLALVGAGSILAGYYSRNTNQAFSSRRPSKLELRFKKPTKIISSDILS